MRMALMSIVSFICGLVLATVIYTMHDRLDSIGQDVRAIRTILEKAARR